MLSHTQTHTRRHAHTQARCPHIVVRHLWRRRIGSVRCDCNVIKISRSFLVARAVVDTRPLEVMVSDSRRDQSIRRRYASQNEPDVWFCLPVSRSEMTLTTCVVGIADYKQIHLDAYSTSFRDTTSLTHLTTSRVEQIRGLRRLS